jgi:hypothetical protein
MFLCIGLCVTAQLFAERTTLRDKTDHWLQPSSAEAGGPPKITDDTGDPGGVTVTENNPIGNGTGLLCGLGLMYGAFFVYHNRKKVNNPSSASFFSSSIKP